MSGTSADGVDLVHAEITGKPPRVEAIVTGSKSVLYPDSLRQQVLKAMRIPFSAQEFALLHADLGRFYAQNALTMTKADLVALHGQTIWHEPPLTTLQIGEAAFIAAALQIPVVSDFRPADLALGGQAAPLVAYPDFLLYGEPGHRRSIHNLGGISNLTYIPSNNSEDLLAFDTGPANCLIDEAAATLGLNFDRDGKLAQAGKSDLGLVTNWLNHPYLRLPPPKSTGRETWHLGNLPGIERVQGADLIATVTTFTVASISRAYQDFVLPLGLDEIYLAGGGSANPVLVAGLRAALPVAVRPLADLGVAECDREALAFAVLGYLRYHNIPNIAAPATGAKAWARGGKISLP